MIARGLATAAFLAFAWAAILLELAPIGGAAGALSAPDLLFCVVAAFAARPDGRGAPLLAVFLAGLLRDALAGGALGLGALALAMAAEGVRLGAASGRGRSLAARWARATLWAAAASAMVWLGLLISFSPTPPLSEVALRLVMTALVYPVVALAVMAARIGRDAALPEGPRMRRIA